MLLLEACLCGCYVWLTLSSQTTRIRRHNNAEKLYNLFQVCMNGVLFFSPIMVLGAAYPLSGWSWNPVSEPNIWLLSMSSVDMSHSHWILDLYHWTRYVDWVDTLIQWNHGKPVSPLHVIHHGTMPLVTSWAILEGAAAPSCFYGVVLWNAFVHICMYSYYYLCSAGWLSPEQRSGKRYLTMFQMLQFVMVAIQSLLGMWFHDERERTPFRVFQIQCAYMCFMMLMFTDWYRRSYKSPSNCSSQRKIK